MLAHVCILMACVFWGLMSPLGKDAMMNGVDGICMVSFRVIGGAALFWLTSLFVKKERVPWRDRLLLALAGLFGLVFNQCCFTIGLNITSPINASIVTTRCLFCNAAGSGYLARTHHGKEGGGRDDGMLWRRNTYPYQRNN